MSVLAKAKERSTRSSKAQNPRAVVVNFLRRLNRRVKTIVSALRRLLLRRVVVLR